MATTFELIQAFTVGSGGAADIDFNTIPSTYTDLCLKVSARSTGASDWVTLKFNNNSSGYSNRHLQGAGSGTPASFTQSTFEYAMINNQSGSTASTFSNSEVYIPNYAGSANKSYSIDTVGEANATTAYAEINAQLWSNTAAINRITLTSLVGNLAQYTTAYLYGVKNA